MEDKKRYAFIKNALRSASQKWPPRNNVKKAARVRTGLYKCAGYKRRTHQVRCSLKEGTKRVNNVFIDHIEPVIPVTGFECWDETIDRMFCSEDGLQLLCKECHDKKTNDERDLRKRYK